MLRSFNIRRFVKCPHYNYSSVSPSTQNVNFPNVDSKSVEKNEPIVTDQSQLVAAAFESLKEISNGSKTKKNFQITVASAKDLDSLLEFVDKPTFTRHSALVILNVLTNWVNERKIKLADFELDQRFIKLCRVLGGMQMGSQNSEIADLSVVLGVTADEQAAKLISSISLPQMIKILKSLSLKKRRSTPLLRSLTYNIASSSELLDVKEASDVFYSLAELNYPDEVLLEKVRESLLECLSKTNTPSVVGSVIRSIGLLRYRDVELLDHLSEWIITHSLSLQTKDLLPLVLTLSCVNYVPENFPHFYKILKPRLNENEMVDVDKFVDVIWSLVILKQCDQDVIEKVLNPTFVSKLAGKYGSVESIEVSKKMRLVQINSAAKQLKDSYNGPFLDENSAFYQVSLSQRKEKQLMTDSVRDALSNIVTPLDEYTLSNADSNMGFPIDLVCFVDNRSSLVKITSPNPNEDKKSIALMMCDYHDFSRGSQPELIGSTALRHRLLSGEGYFVVPIPHTEYDNKDVLMNRVRYIHERIKKALSET